MVGSKSAQLLAKGQIFINMTVLLLNMLSYFISQPPWLVVSEPKTLA